MAVAVRIEKTAPKINFMFELHVALSFLMAESYLV